MSKKSSSFVDVLNSIFAPVAIIVAFIVAWILFKNVMGNPVNFVEGNINAFALVVEDNVLSLANVDRHLVGPKPECNLP